MTWRSRRWGGAATVACIAAAAVAPPAGAAMTPELEDALGRAAPTDRLSVVATLKNQVEPVPGTDPATILRALRVEARQTQPALLARLGLTNVRRFSFVNAIAVVSVPDEVRRIAADPAVSRVNLDPHVVLADQPAPTSTPTRRLFQDGSGSWSLQEVRAPEAWRGVGTTGRSVRVGAIDTGIDADHPALAGKVVGWRDLIGGRPVPYDDHGHGTHTAGTIAGGNTKLASLGVAPGARLLVAKAIRGDGSGVGSDILAAAEWLADPDGNPATLDYPKVISNSWGELSDPNDIWFRPMLRRWRALDILAVFAAGNAGPGDSTVGSPSGYPDALSIGAVNRNRLVPAFSSHGPVDWQNRDGFGPPAGAILKPDLAAPGVNIVSSKNGGGYQSISGTSMAAPHAAGVAALVRSANPTLTAPEVERILRSTAVNVGPPGRDNEAGDGLVDALGATRVAARRPGASPEVQAFLARDLKKRAQKIQGTIKLTVAQLRINQKIALAAVSRVDRLEARLGFSGLHPLIVKPRWKIREVSAGQMKYSQGIARAALRRATAIQRYVANPSAVAISPLSPVERGRIRVTLGQVFINQRIARAALRRVALSEHQAETAGIIPSD